MLKTTPAQAPGHVPGQARNGRQIDEKHLGIGRGFYMFLPFTDRSSTGKSS